MLGESSAVASDEFSDTSDMSSSEDDFDSSYDILSNPTNSININHYLLFPKYDQENITVDTKKSCKILKFDSEWSFAEILIQIKEFDSKVFQNLLILIVESDDIKLKKRRRIDKTDKKTETNEQKLIKVLKKFIKTRPMILQFTSEDEDTSKFYFKSLGSKKFKKITNKPNDLNVLKDFPSFLWLFLSENFENFEQEMCNLKPTIQNSSLIYRFLRTLAMTESFLTKLVLRCGNIGSKNDIMAIMNFSLDNENEALNSTLKDYLIKTDLFNDRTEKSLLSNSIENNNKGVHELIVKYCAKLIGKFSYSFQLSISSAVYEKNQLDYLCDLVNVCDFPFPNDLEINSVTHEKFKSIIENRNKFSNAIKTNSIEEINKYIEAHPDFKFVYSTSNSSALHQAVNVKQFKLLSQLESKGFISPEYHNYCEVTKDEESKKIAKRFALLKRRGNVNTAVPHANKSVMLLSIKSFIHNKIISEATYYRSLIEKWFNNIYNDEDNKPHLDVVAQCENLKMVFDFDSEEVNNIDPLTTGAEGVMHPSSKWIFIGAKTTDENSKNRESNIEGVITHENYHYAMELRYENESKPYFKYDKETEVKFEKIVNELNLWKKFGTNDPDDECDEIISSVYRLYEKEDFHCELIVRAVQILIVYQHDKLKLQALKLKYKALFDFHREHVVPDLKNFNLKDHENIRKFNKTAGKLEEMKTCELKFSNLNSTSELICSQFTVLITNIPTLLIYNIYKSLAAKYENILVTKTIFLCTQLLKNNHILNELKSILKKSSDLNIILDCSKGYDETLKKLAENKKNFLTFIINNDDQYENLSKIFQITQFKEINYKWSDLSLESKEKLLQTKIMFLTNLISIEKLLLKREKVPISEHKIPIEVPTIEKKQSRTDLPDSINDELFKLLVEKSEIVISQKSDENQIEMKKFDTLYRARNFIFIHGFKSKIDEIELTQEGLLDNTAGKKIILVSDLAGTGKSWFSKKLKNIMCKEHPEIWTTVVDLKQYTAVFALIQESSQTLFFLDFMVKKVLNLKHLHKVEIYSKMYENGKVCVFFDGFDEIAPNYAKIVMILIKSFEFNGGNQLWIATRDFFEVTLRTELNLDEVYKLKPFKEEDGIELITSGLILHDSTSNAGNDFQEQIKSHPKYEFFYEKARKLNKMILRMNNKLIGSPQLFQMIGDIYRNIDMEALEITIYKIFENFVKIYYERWSFQKGEIRKAANISSLMWNLNYLKLHQYFAMKGSYPHKSKFCGLAFNANEWSHEEIIACGLLIKRGEEFQFQHETFREFFIAHFLLNFLKSIDEENINEEFLGYMKNILMNVKFGIVRMFINDALSEQEFSKPISRVLPKIAENIENLNFLLNIFKNGLDNLEDLWNNYFKSLNYEKLKDVLFSDKESILNISRDEYLCSKFKKFPFMLLNQQDLFSLMQHRNDAGDSFLYIISKRNQQQIINIIEVLKGIFSTTQLCNLIKSKGKYGRNFLHLTALTSKDKEIHEYLWNLYRNLCESDQEFLKTFEMLDFKGEGVLNLAARSASKEVFEFMIKELDKIASKEYIRKLLHIVTENDKITFDVVTKINEPDFHHYFIKVMDNFNLNEILTITRQFSDNEDKLFYEDDMIDTVQITDQIWKKIKSIAEEAARSGAIVSDKIVKDLLDSSQPKYVLRQLLSVTVHLKRNFLQIAALNNKSLEFHEYLWEIIRKYFDKSEILEMITEVDNNIHNVLDAAVYSGSRELAEMTWHNILDAISNFESLNDAVQKCNVHFNILVKNYDDLKTRGDFLEHSAEFRKSIMLQTSLEISNKIIREEVSITNFVILHKIVSNTLIEFHQQLWHIMQSKFPNGDELLSLLMKQNQNANNYCHLLVKHNKQEIIDFTFNKCKDVFGTSKFTEILKAKGETGQNFIQISICNSNDIQLQKYIWTLFSKNFLDKNEFLAIISERNKLRTNTIYTAFGYSSNEFIKFIIENLANIMAPDEIKKLLATKLFFDENIIHYTLSKNKSLELHKILWTTIENYFSQPEILNLVNNNDRDGGTILHHSAYWNTKEITEFTWTQIKKYISLKEDQVEYLTRKGHHGKNLIEMSSENRLSDSQVHVWVLNLWSEYDI